MKRKHLGILVLALAMLFMLSQAVFATEGDETGGEGTEPEKAVRTVLLYMCGSDLETNAGMATHNLKQILGSNFSSDEDINFVVMTGGAWRWQLDNDKDPENANDYLVFPKGVSVPDDAVLYPDPADAKKVKQAENEKGSISGVYNQIWEARGVDANDEYVKEDADHGKLVLLDGDGLTGTEVKGENELMSDPNTLKAFINYGVQNYPAEKYDLILWDHAGGPAGGFAIDQHFDKEADGAKPEDTNMSFSEIVGAISDNAVTAPKDGQAPQKFDFIDFDACLMNSLELNLALVDYTDYYIASAEVEPGYGQDYRGWLNMIGETPDKNAFDIGKKIVDDFYDFYDSGDGVGQDGTLAVVDMKKLMESELIDTLSEMTALMKQQAADCAFYDEFNSALDSIRYGQYMNYFDLGNFAATLSVVNMELEADDLDKEKLETDNVYSKADIANRINRILTNPDIIYAKGTGGIIAREKLFRNASGEPEIGSLHTSGMYVFFTTPDAPDQRDNLLSYFEELSSVIEKMPENDARRLLLTDYRDVLADYALITYSGKAVNWLIKEENVDRKTIDYEKVRYNWTEGREDVETAATEWNWSIKTVFKMRKDGESAEAKAWLDEIAKQQAKEALSIENISAKKVKTKDGIGYKVKIGGAKARSIGSIERSVGLEFSKLTETINNMDASQDMKEMLWRAVGYGAGTVEGHITDDDIVMEDATAEEIIRWFNRDESDWDVDSPDNCWYAIKDSKNNLHAVAIDDESQDAYFVGAEILTHDEKGTPVRVPTTLKFVKGETEAHLTELIFRTTDGAFRPIKVTDLTSTYTVQPVMLATVQEIWGKPTYALPTSESTFELSADMDLTLEYTDIENLSDDIKDVDGDGQVYRNTFEVKDIYGNHLNIKELIDAAEETVTSIDLARVKHKVYTGEKQTPELAYLGETLKEGEDYTWDFYHEPNRDLTEPGNYRLRFKGIGKFTGYVIRQFKIIHDKDVAQEMVVTAEEEMQLANEAFAAIVDSDDKTRLKEAYERLVNAQNALADAEKVLADTKDLLAQEQQEELEGKISDLENQIQDLNKELAKAQALDISRYAVTTASSAVYTGKVIKPAVKVSGLASSVYKVTYKNNKKVGKATVLIQANNSNYTGSITKTFTIKPAKAGQPKVKVGKKKMTVTAKAKVSKTGGTFYQVRYKVKGKVKWKTVKTKKQKVTIKKLKKGKRYQVQIRAFSKTGGKTYYGAWSKVRTTKKIR